MTCLRPLLPVLGLTLAFAGCSPVVDDAADGDASGSSEDSASPGFGAADEDPSGSSDDGGGPGIALTGGQDEGSVGDADGGESDGGDPADAETSTDDGGVPAENVACLEVAECLIGQPFAQAPCAAASNVSPTQCGYIPVCAREIEWVDADGAPVLPPATIDVGYTHAGQPVFVPVGHACYEPGDGSSCVIPCDVAPAPPTPLKAARVTYRCVGSTSTRTQVILADDLDGPIVLTC